MELLFSIVKLEYAFSGCCIGGRSFECGSVAISVIPVGVGSCFCSARLSCLGGSEVVELLWSQFNLPKVSNLGNRYEAFSNCCCSLLTEYCCKFY